MTPEFRALIVISIFIWQAAISNASSLKDCRILLDSMAFDGIPVCKISHDIETGLRNADYSQSIIENEDKQKDFPCQQNYTIESQNIPNTFIAIIQKEKASFTRKVKGNNYSLTRIQIEILVKKEYLRNNNIINLEINIDEKSRTFPLKMKDTTFSNWVALTFNGAISSEFNNLAIIFSSIINQKVNHPSMIIDNPFVFSQFTIWGQYYFDKFEKDFSQKQSNDSSQSFLIHESSQKDQQFLNNPSISCQAGFIFDGYILQCKREETNSCPGNTKEILRSKQCVDTCPKGQFELTLSSYNNRIYCSEGYDFCHESCEICDLSGNICFICKDNFILSTQGQCIEVQDNLVHTIQHNQERSLGTVQEHQQPNILQELSSIESSTVNLNPNQTPRILYTAEAYRCLSEFNTGQDCYECVEPFVMVHGDCFLCPRSTYPVFDLYSSSCQIIPDTGCSDYNSTNNCQACFLDYHFNSGICTRATVCSLTQYLGTDLVCHNCSTSIPNCIHCYTSDICRDCAPGFHLYSSNGSSDTPTLSCISTCPDGYFVNSNNLCEPCGSKCKTCTGSGAVCTTCMTNFQTVSGYYNNSPTTKQRCMALNGDCTRGCISCTFYTGYNYCNNNCLNINFFYNLGFCYYCGDNCQICQSSTVCQTCKAGITLVGGQCPRTCPAGKYLDSNSNCTTCNNSSKCASCTNSRLCSACSAGYIALGGFCANCPSNCNVCSNEITCITCKTGFTLNPVTYQCSGCLSNQYLVSSTCVNCPSECTACTSPTVCSSCATGYNLNSSACDIICTGSNYRDSATNTCKPCSSICSTCSSSTVCTGCITGYSLNAPSCDIICSSSNYRNSATNTCLPCPTGCSACSSSTLCTSCITGYSFASPNCNIICSSSFFRDSSTNTCKPCISNCSACSNSSSCSTCSTGYTLLLNGTCSQTSICGDGKLFIPVIISGVAYSKECDDKNTLNGDGCSNTCQVEDGFSCQYNFSMLKSVCQKIIIKNDFTLDPQSNLKNDNPIIKIKFDIALVQYSTNNLLSSLIQDMTISISTVSSSQYSFTVSINSANDELTLTFTLSVAAKNKIFTITFNSNAFVTQNFLTDNSKTCDFPDYVLISAGAAAAADAIASVGSATSSSILAAILPIIIFANFQLLFNALDLFQMIFYLQYVEVRIPYNAIAFIDIMSSFKLPISANYFEYLLQAYPLRKCYVPNSFADSDVEGLFLGNTGDSISQISILLAFHLLLRYLGKFLASRQSKRPKQIGTFLKRKLYESWEYGWYLDMYWEMYLSLVVGAILQFYQIEIYNFFSAINIILTFLIFIIVIISPFLFWRIIKKKKSHLEDERIRFKWGMLYESLQIEEPAKIYPITHPNKILHNQKNIEKKTTNAGSLELEGDYFQNNNNNSPYPINHVNSLNNSPGILAGTTPFMKQSTTFVFDRITQNLSDQQDNTLKNQITNTSLFSSLTYISLKSRLTKYYYVALYFRKLLFGIVIASATSFPYFQISFLCVLNGILITYVVLTKPYHSKFENVKSIICEILMVIAQISFIFLIPDPEDQDESQRINIGWIFIFCCSGILVLQFIFIFATFIPQMKQRLHQICCKNKNKIAIQPEENIQKQQEILQSPSQEEVTNKKPKITLQIDQSNQEVNIENEIPRKKVLLLHSPEKRFRKISNSNVKQFDELFGNQLTTLTTSVNPLSRTPVPEIDQDIQLLQLQKSQAPKVSLLPSLNRLSPQDSPQNSNKNTPIDNHIGSLNYLKTPSILSADFNGSHINKKKKTFLEQMKKFQAKRIFQKSFLDVPRSDDDFVSSNSKDIKDLSEIRDRSTCKENENNLENSSHSLRKEINASISKIITTPRINVSNNLVEQVEQTELTQNNNNK